MKKNFELKKSIREGFSKEYLWYLVLLLFISIPLFNKNLYRISGGHDINFHLMRIEGIAEGLKMGQFPVKIQPAWYDGYGYGCSVFYGDLFLYAPAVLRLFGVSLQKAYKIYIFLVQMATIGIASFSFKRIFQEKKIAVFGTTLYALAVYRLMNIFVRGAMGEYTAMVFLPLLAYALLLLLQKESGKKELRKGVFLLAFGMTGILQSHILSAEIVCIVIAVLCVIYMKRVFSRPVFLSFLKAVCLTLLLNLGFLVPFADYMITGKFNVNAINGGWRVEQNIQEYGAFFSQLGKAFYRAGGDNLPKEFGTAGEMPIGVGLALMLALLVFIVLGFQLSKQEKTQHFWKLAKASCFIAVFSLLLSTCYFPWEVLRKSNVLMRYLIINLQFPWRFCVIASVSLVMLWCCLMQIMGAKWNLKYTKAIGVAVVVLSAVTAGTFMADVLREGQAFRAVFAEDMDTMVKSGEEYLPVNTVSREFKKDYFGNAGAVTITNFVRNGIQLTFECENLSAESQWLEVPLLYYRGYVARAWKDGSNATLLPVGSGNNQVVSIEIPAEFTGKIRVDFGEAWYWRLAEGISFLTLLMLGMRYILGKKRESML